VELDDGTRVKTFKDIARANMDHFKNLFKDPNFAIIEVLMKVIWTSPRCFNQEMNDGLTAGVRE
jgi:hypothetical protein